MPMSIAVSFCSPLHVNSSHHHIISHSSSHKIASHYLYSVTHAKELSWSPPTILIRMKSSTRLRAASTDNNVEDNKEPASISATSKDDLAAREPASISVTSKDDLAARNMSYDYDMLEPASISATSKDDLAAKGQASLSDTSKDDLAAKLAAAEAEAEALRRELAARKGNREIDLSKLKPTIPEKRIDGVGYRETIFSAPGKAMGTEVEQPSKWGLSEAELFFSKGAPSERTETSSPSIEDNSKEIVTRRLLIGTGLVLSAIGLAYLKLPTGLVKPSKPIFVYVIPILQLREQLMTIENFASDLNSVRFQLKKINDSDELSKDIFLSAAGYLDGADRDTASSITYSIFDYLNQADYNKYFDYMGQPSVSQQLDFLKFSLKSIQAAREQIDKFLSLIPQEELQAAKSQIMR